MESTTTNHPEPESSESDNWITSRSSLSFQKKMQTVSGQNPMDEFYKMDHSKRGMALIFNHKVFEHPYLKDREGTEKDRDRLEEALKKLKFDVSTHNDLNRIDVLQTLKSVSKKDHSNHDCIVIAILSHGESRGRIFAKDNDYSTSEIIGYFSGDNCPSLAGKPKLFLIQACRGSNVDDGVRMKYESDAITEKNEIFYTIPAMADILIMYATVEGYYSWRDTKKGSVFIQSLSHILVDCHKERDLLSMLTVVNRQVAIGFTSNTMDPKLRGKKEMCSIVSMLTRLLYFT